MITVKIPSKRIGLISGLGPLAGSDVLAKIFQYSADEYGAVEDLEYPEVILISKGIAGFDNKASTSKAFTKELAFAIKKLNKLDVDIIGIACNTAHIYHSDLSAKSDTPLVNLVEEVAKSIPKNKKRRYILLSSSSTRDSKLYEKALFANNIDFKTADDKTQKQLDDIIYKIMGHNLKQAGKQFEDLLDSLSPKEYEGIIAGCTELPLAANHINISFQKKIIDSNLVLAKILTDIAYERKN